MVSSNSGGSSQIREGKHRIHHLHRPDLGPPSGSLQGLIKVHLSNDNISLKGFYPASRLPPQNHLSPPSLASGTQLLKSSHALSRFCAYTCAHTGVHTPSGQHLPSPRLAPYYPAKATHPGPTLPFFILKPNPFLGEVILCESETTLSKNPRFSVD